MFYYKMKKSPTARKHRLDSKTKIVTKFVPELVAAFDLQNFDSSSGPNSARFENADEAGEIERGLNKYYITA